MPGIDNPRFASFFARLFGVTGAGGPETVLPDVLPTLDLWSDSADCRWTRGEILFDVGFTSAAGGVGFFSRCLVRPAAGRLLILTSVRVRKATAGLIYLLHDDSSLLAFSPYTIGGANTGFVHDGRARRETSPGIEIRLETANVAWGGTTQDSVVAANVWQNFYLGEPFVLMPPFAIGIENGTANEGLQAQFFGWTRPYDTNTEGR